MPGRNIYKDYVSESYYHIYNRGIDGQTIFRENSDYIVFLSLLKRYLGQEPSRKPSGVLHPSFKDSIDLLAFCLMPNHFHLFIYQHTEAAISELLRSISVSYVMYFNKKYRRTGPLFQQRYRAKRISDDAYLLHISRYIHLNPNDYKSWEWSSLPYYNQRMKADWLKPNRVLDLFKEGEYSDFVDDYQETKFEIETIRHQLADQI